MKPSLKKWLATSLEIASVIAFAGFGFLAGDAIKQWYRTGFSGKPPTVVWLWLAIGLLLGVSRYFVSRYSRQETIGILSAPGFVGGYRQTLETSIATLVSLLRSPSIQPELLESAERAVLRAITKVVDHFRNATANRTDVNCVLMEPIAFDPETDSTEDILGLEAGGLQHLVRVLTITKMAQEDIDVPVFLLPIYDLEGDFRDKTPFGAPRTLVTGQNQIVNFTLWLVPHRGHSSWPVLVEFWKHFWRVRGRFLSFASLPVTSGNQVVAVLNVHCKSRKVFGRNPAVLIDFLIPFIAILSYIYELKEIRRTS